MVRGGWLSVPLQWPQRFQNSIRGHSYGGSSHLPRTCRKVRRLECLERSG